MAKDSVSLDEEVLDWLDDPLNTIEDPWKGFVWEDLSHRRWLKDTFVFANLMMWSSPIIFGVVFVALLAAGLIAGAELSGLALLAALSALAQGYLLLHAQTIARVGGLRIPYFLAWFWGKAVFGPGVVSSVVLIPALAGMLASSWMGTLASYRVAIFVIVVGFAVCCIATPLTVHFSDFGRSSLLARFPGLSNDSRVLTRDSQSVGSEKSRHSSDRSAYRETRPGETGQHAGVKSWRSDPIQARGSSGLHDPTNAVMVTIGACTSFATAVWFFSFGENPAIMALIGSTGGFTTAMYILLISRRSQALRNG